MTEPHKTPRTDAAWLEHISTVSRDTVGFREHASALEIETQELAKALELAVSLVEVLEAAAQFAAVPGDYPMDALDKLKQALASAESATPAKHCEDCAPEFGCWDGGESCYKHPLQSSTPAKHPDTVRLDWLEQNEAVVTVDRRILRPVEVVTEKIDAVCADTLRAAIDAAMEEARHD